MFTTNIIFNYLHSAPIVLYVYFNTFISDIRLPCLTPEILPDIGQAAVETETEAGDRCESRPGVSG